MFDHTERTGENTIIVDDATGSPAGIPLSQAMKDALDRRRPAARRALARRQWQGRRFQDSQAPRSPTSSSRTYFADVAAKVVLPMFKARNKPFVLVFWSRDPDGTPAQPRRQPAQRDARHQRADLARRDQERRRQSRHASARRSTSSASPRPPTSSSRPTTASPPSRRRARPARPRRRATPTCRPACCRPAFVAHRSRQGARQLPLSIPTTRTPRVAAGSLSDSAATA